MWIDPTGLYAVIARYIARRNDGTMFVEGQQNVGEHFWEATHIAITIGDTTQRFSIQDGTVTSQDGHWIIDSSHLMEAFGLTQTQATHQPWDAFGSMDTAAIAFSLMHTQRSTDMGREIGSIIYAVSDLRGNHSHYTFGRTWVGGERDVIAGLTYRILFPERSRLTHSMVALAHTHPPGDNRFSGPDMDLAHGRFNIAGVGVPAMPVFMSVTMAGNRMEVRRYDDTMNRNSAGRLIFLW